MLWERGTSRWRGGTVKTDPTPRERRQSGTRRLGQSVQVDLGCAGLYVLGGFRLLLSHLCCGLSIARESESLAVAVLEAESCRDYRFVTEVEDSARCKSGSSETCKRDAREVIISTLSPLLSSDSCLKAILLASDRSCAPLQSSMSNRRILLLLIVFSPLGAHSRPRVVSRPVCLRLRGCLPKASTGSHAHQ